MFTVVSYYDLLVVFVVVGVGYSFIMFFVLFLIFCMY